MSTGLGNRMVQDGFVWLQGRDSCVILEVPPTGAPLWRYWGLKLEAADIALIPLAQHQPVPTFSLDRNVPLSVFPTFGMGWFGAPALLAHRSGQDFGQDFTRCDVRWVVENRHIIVTLQDEVAHIEVALEMSLHPLNDVLSCQIRLTNKGEAPLEIQHCAAACLPLPPSATKVRAYSGAHNREFHLFENRLSPATWLRENRSGLTSHACPPVGIVVADHTTLDSGPAYGAQLAWSGSHFQRIEAIGDGGYQWQWGEWLAPGEMRLEAGQTLTSPEVIATFSAQGLNGVAHNFHAQARSLIGWPKGGMSPRPVHFNTWEGVYFNLTQAALLDMATGAAALGAERFVLDDGWFKGRRHDQAGLGDWWVDEAIFPDGLHPLCDHVAALGMSFGLWVEPEMINPDSDLYRTHPDWALHLEGRPLLTARNQLVLDLSNRDAFAYVLGRLRVLLKEYPIGYLKWDHNRDLTAGGHQGRAAFHSQTRQAYALLAALRTQFPDVEIEACAGGGGRIDAGILSFTHRFWVSDCIDGVSRVSIQRGFLQFFPPELMGSHIGASPSHATGRSQSLGFRAAVALGGHLGIELDPRHLAIDEKSKTAQWIALYKSLRDTLHQGQVWQGEAGDGIVWQAHKNGEHIVVLVYRIAPSIQRFPPALRLGFLSDHSHYQITQLAPDVIFAPSDGPFFEKLAAGEVVISGQQLAELGLPLPFMKAETALVLQFIAMEKH